MQNLGISLVFAAVLILNFAEPALAQTGSDIFKRAACDILGPVLTGSFGAMISVFAGVFALVAAVTGSYRGAWALLFVSVGAFLAKNVVGVLFSGVQNC